MVLLDHVRPNGAIEVLACLRQLAHVVVAEAEREIGLEDQTFVAKISDNPQSGAIIHAIIGLGRSLHLPVIAEGVETEAQLAFLKAEGCAEIQGYLIGRPQPIAHYHNVVAGTNAQVKRAG